MRSGLAHALHHARHRSVFGKHLADQPLMRRVLADMALHAEAATALVMRLCHAFDRAPHDPVESAIMRLMTPVVKYWVCKSAPAFLYEAMECLGGNGYVEEGILARHYREAPVNAIWEGSGNVMCLDVLRVVLRERDAVAAALAHLAQEGGDLPDVKAALSSVAAALGQPDAEGAARDAVERLALAAAAVALKAVHSGHAALFAQTRLARRRGLMYGAVDLAPNEIQGLLARALP
jgi:putative acyl-CoA dehydrogenase